MTRFMDCDRATFLSSGNFGAFFETANDAVNGVHKILTLHHSFLMASSNESRLVAHIGNISARESGSLTSKKVNIDA